MTAHESSFHAARRRSLRWSAALLLAGGAALTAGAQPARAGFVQDNFNNDGTASTDTIAGFSSGSGWGGAWFSTTPGATDNPGYSAGSQLSFSNSDYETPNQETGPEDGRTVQGANGSARGIIARQFATPMTGSTIWISALAESNGGSVLFWPDQKADTTAFDDDPQSVSRNFVRLKGGDNNPRDINVDINGDDDAHVPPPSGSDDTVLMLMRITLNSGSNGEDTLDAWIKGSLDDVSSVSALGSPQVSKSDEDLYGDALYGLGFAESDATDATLDVLRVSDRDTAYNDVIKGASVVIPEPASLALLGVGMLGMFSGRRRKRA